MKSNKQNIHLESKRQFLRGLTALIGGVAVSQLTSTNALANAFNYEAQPDSALKAGKVFSKPQMQILHDICATVLPKTDTPSAAELDVHGFLDHQLSACYSNTQQTQAINLVDKINQQSKTNYAKGFNHISSEQQTALLVALESQALGFSAQDKKQFSALKSLLIFGYFTTEVGATQALNYQAIPGGFKGSVPYSTLKKSWGSLAFY
ncbi:gluconate 2-dehydrogenase subunit 3 family protein [Colwellia sp. 20A7]|uniref:gluconate 2-dehydrogenase subunit 3 family protein n=1 Tax=Colwellia sp. 20A7 TaxID=2689569 RepID=UPI0013593EBC|nr:gluconate 2-dehydrogenase subunit 3 family protein [Colwellia sp. 20A7]